MIKKKPKLSEELILKLREHRVIPAFKYNRKKEKEMDRRMGYDR